MSRTFLAAFAAAVIAGGLALVLAASAPAAPAPKTVHGTVGPSFTIGMTLNGKKVAKLKKGVAYRFVISDRSPIHDFHLSGPGLNRMLTTVGFTGTRTLVLTLKKGVYRFFCDPHASVMHGSFRVA